MFTRLGWIGTGVMGASMCGHLMAAGFSMTVYNRTREKAQGLLARGAVWADSPRAVAEASEVIFTIVGYPADVRSVILGDDGALAGCRPGNVIVDMTTSQPSLAVEIAEAAARVGVQSIDAPVSGGDVGAREARLSIMIGGDKQVVEALRPCWEAMGKTIVYQGGPGAGQHTKLVNQVVIAGNMIGVCEGLLYAYRAGLDLPTVLQSIGSGAAASWSLSNLGTRIIDNNFDPGFFVEHFIKDMGIALDEAKRMGLVMPGLALVHQLYLALLAHGRGRYGTQALQLALADLAGINWGSRGEEGRRRKDEGRRTKDEGLRRKDEGRRTKDEGRRTKEEGRRTKDEGRRTKDEGGRRKEEGGRTTERRIPCWLPLPSPLSPLPCFP